MLIDGVNDRAQDADAIASVLEPIHAVTHAACQETGRRSKRTGVLVNLIPFNSVDGAGLSPGTHFRPPSRSAVEAFQARLRSRGVWTSVRRQRGDDEAAACGQLTTTSRRSSNRLQEGSRDQRTPTAASTSGGSSS